MTSRFPTRRKRGGQPGNRNARGNRGGAPRGNRNALRNKGGAPRGNRNACKKPTAPHLIFHTVHYGRCSLALDLMEEFRPLIADRLALNLVNLDIIKAGDFHKEDGKGFYFIF